MWNNQQLSALRKIKDWLLQQQKPYFVLSGYAGTGKTTLAKAVCNMVGGDVYFAAYTGKAAHALAKAGAPNASTIHSLIYTPASKSKQHLEKLKQLLAKQKDPQKQQQLKQEIKQEEQNLTRPAFKLNLDSPLNKASLVVVDEHSMISKRMGTDLLSFGCPVLALGDPAQLPPVRAKPFFTGKPDALLTQIHRQAAGSPVLHLATLARKHKRIPVGNYGECSVLSYAQARESLKEDALAYRQLLCGRNKTRISSNRRIRQLMGRLSWEPTKGDRVICLRNNHELGLFNGQINTLQAVTLLDRYVALQFDDVGCVAHLDYFKGSKPPFYEIDEAECFDYAYAITVHKAQGSQWDNVLLFDEWHGSHRAEWLYTAITRAANKIKIIQF